jgi:flagellar assembly factor FliW
MPTTLESRRFGSLPVADEEILRFPEGLPGFEELREFLLLSPPDLAPVQFLVSLQVPEIIFPILPASLCLGKYAPTIDAADCHDLGAADGSAFAIYAILTFHHEREEVTANLRAPVLINPLARLGRQVTLVDSTYSLRHPLLGG